MSVLAAAVEVGHIDRLVANIARGAIVQKLLTQVKLAVDLHVAVSVEHQGPRDEEIAIGGAVLVGEVAHSLHHGHHLRRHLRLILADCGAG